MPWRCGDLWKLVVTRYFGDSRNFRHLEVIEAGGAHVILEEDRNFRHLEVMEVGGANVILEEDRISDI